MPVSPKSQPRGWGRGGWVVPIMDNRGGSARRGYHLQVSGIGKGREISHFGLQKGPKGLKDDFDGCEVVEKTFWFCDLFIFIIQSFTIVEGNVKFLTSHVKGSPINGQQKGYLFWQKWYMKKVRGWTIGRSLPD